MTSVIRPLTRTSDQQKREELAGMRKRLRQALTNNDYRNIPDAYDCYVDALVEQLDAETVRRENLEWKVSQLAETLRRLDDSSEEN